jgi:zinc protease
VYAAQVDESTSVVFDYGYIRAITQLPPEKASQFYDAVNAIVADLKATKLTQDDLDRARIPALQALKESQQTNEYWLALLNGAQEDKRRLDLARNYEAALLQVTTLDIVAAAQKYLLERNSVKLSCGS